MLMCMVFALAVIALAVLDPHRPPADTLVLDRADEAVFSTAGGAVLWEARDVALSQNWSTDTPLAVRRADEPVTGRYTLHFDLPSPPAHASIMIPRVSQALRIEINGETVHDDDSHNALARWDWYSPVIAEVPQDLIGTQGNRLVLAVTAAPGTVSGLSRIFLGEEHAIARMGERLDLLQSRLPTLANVSVIAMSIPLLLIWAHGRGVAATPFRIYGLLAAASIVFAVRSMHVHAGELSISYPLWLFLVGSSLGWALGFFYSFMLHFVEAGSKRSDMALAAFVAVGTALMAAIPERLLAEFSTLLWYMPLAAVGAGCVFVVCLRTVRAPDIGRVALSLSLLLLLVAGIHDAMWSRGLLRFESLLWMPLIMPIVLLAISISVANRFVAAWISADALNRNLAARVREAEAEIAASYERRLEAERRETLADERAKLVEDLHDGVGGRLSMLLAALQVSQLSRGRIVEVLRDCLGDLRMIISARDSSTLGDALAELCGQLGHLLETRGIGLEVEIDPQAAALRMEPRRLLDMLRIVQEACTNAARHGRGDRIRVECRLCGPHMLRVAVSDGGAERKVTSAEAGSSGRGLPGMKTRAGRMNAALSAGPLGSGWQVVLDVPVSHAPAAGRTGEPHKELAAE